MSRAPQRSRQAPVRRPTPPTRSSARASSSTGGTGPGRKTWLLVGAGLLAFVVVWRVGMSFLGGEDPAEGSRRPLPTGSGTVDPGGSGDAPPAPEGTRSATFPAGVEGSRLILRVITLGSEPADCLPGSLRTGGRVRVVYHHRCLEEGGVDRYFFLVRLTNLVKGRVFVGLDGFRVLGPNGHPREVFATPPLGSPSTRFIPQSRGIATDSSLRGWITIDGTGGFAPAVLIYHDGAETLRVRFEGDWV